MKHKYLLLTIILFFFLVLFSATSLALIPGDFGSADNGPPDGVVDFEDLMLFAMAYGTASGDANWNPLCDIAGQGSATPDGVIDFEDLMIFAMNYGRRGPVTGITVVTSITNAERNNFPDTVSKDLENKKRSREDYRSIESKLKEGSGHHIYVHWSTYSEANGYKVYRKVNEGDFVEAFDGYPPPSSNWPGWKGHGWYDFDVQDGNTYSYYVIAYGTGWQTDASEIVTRRTWLPLCSLNSPSEGAIITTSEPTFSWNPIGLDTSDFPYGDICYGITHLWMFDISTVEFDVSTGERVWWSSFDDMTTSTATYNYDGNATPLVPGHSYTWCTLGHGYDENDNFIAGSGSEWREFIYVGDEAAIISEVNAYTVTDHLYRDKSFIEATKLESGSRPGSTYYFNEPQGTKEGDIEYGMHIYWSAYLAASGCGYKVYKSINSSTPTVVFSQEAPSGYDWYDWWDENVAPGNTYSYYVTAYGDFGETLPSETVTRETWLPHSSAISPVHNSIITDPNPVFTWNSTGVTTPYEDIDSGETILRVWDETSGGDDGPIWTLFLDGLTVSTVTYNQDGEAPPLIPGHLYSWNTGAHGCSEDEHLMAISWTENWQFYYGYQPFEVTYRTETFSPDENAVGILWKDYSTATDYEIYKSTDGTSFDQLSGDYEIDGDWYEFWDHETIKGNTYYYYVKAFDGATEIQTSPTMTVDTWLPGIVVIEPIEDEVVTDSTPTFIWQYEDSISFPNGPFDFSGAGMNLYDTVLDDEVWEIELNNLDVFSYTYDGPSLVEGHRYTWCRFIEGEGDNGISTATAGRGSFFYGNLVPNVRYCAITCSSGEHQIEIGWGHYPEATNYHIYKNINSGGYTEIFGSYEENEDGHWFIDNDVTDENIYKYYITADTPTGETAPSYTDTIDTWLPPCSLSSPTDEAIVTTSEPTFSWNTIGLETSDFPYGSIFYTGGSHLRVRDENAGNEIVWDIDFDDCVISTATYNQDGQATPLVIGHRYNWWYYCGGHSEEGEYIAESIGENWKFIYTGGASVIISEVNAYTQFENDSAQISQTLDYLVQADLIPPFYQLNEDEISLNKGIEQFMQVQWTAYLQESNCGYKVYRSTNGGGFTEVFSQEAPSGYDWYGWLDWSVSEGNTYSYYVTAFGDGWETAPSETVTREVWLPMTYLESPVDGTNVNESEITFTWLPLGISSYPYHEDIVSGHTILRIFDPNAPDPSEPLITFICEDLTTSEYICTDTTGLANQAYEWNVIAHGVDQEGELAAVSVAGNWGFTYINN